MRDYDPQTGRYIESDPIGLKSGVNTYAYAKQNPLIYIDPLGLVVWKGTYFTAGAGLVTFEIYTLWSRCVNGKKGYARVHALGATYGRGATWGGGNITLDDHLPVVDPNVFNGDYLKVFAGLSAGIGYGFSFLILGGAGSPGAFDFEGGLDASSGVAIGQAWVVEKSLMDCCQ